MKLDIVAQTYLGDGCGGTIYNKDDHSQRAISVEYDSNGIPSYICIFGPEDNDQIPFSIVSLTEDMKIDQTIIGKEDCQQFIEENRISKEDIQKEEERRQEKARIRKTYMY